MNLEQMVVLLVALIPAVMAWLTKVSDKAAVEKVTLTDNLQEDNRYLREERDALRVERVGLLKEISELKIQVQSKQGEQPWVR